MGPGCAFSFHTNRSDGLKRRRIWLPQPLMDKRRDILSDARKAAEGRQLDVAQREFEAAFVDGTWRAVLEPLEPMVRSPPLKWEPINIYNRTLWDMRDFMRSLKLGEELGPVGLFYALYPLME